VHDHCALACPKGPTQESSACEASKCCPLPNGNGTGNGNGNGKESAKSLHNTPVVERRANSFVMAKNVRKHKLMQFKGKSNNILQLKTSLQIHPRVDSKL
jgi:hypothetical protein